MYIFIILTLMILITLLFILFKVLKGGDRHMLVMLMAVNIVAGHYTWNRVPRLLKPQVREQLELMGVPELAEEAELVE